VTDDENDAEIDAKIEWLKDKKDPWSQCVSLWKDTSKVRVGQLVKGKQEIHEYVESFPGLKDKSGYLLVR